MKVNLGVELSDDQRRALASILAGKSVKRLASRDDVREYLTGVVGALAFDGVVEEGDVDDPPAVATTRASVGLYSACEQRLVDRLVAEGKSPEYARGFISAGRVLAQSGHALRVNA